jgi:hypothetical protein
MCPEEATRLSPSQEQEVRAEVSRILEGPSFRTSKRCREFLEYIVERTINGPSDSLKERSIGVELFKLPVDFDSGQHTVVRVTANEVRKKLAQHYLAQGGDQRTVRIALPPGSYSAEFTWDLFLEEAAAGTRPSEPTPADIKPLNDTERLEPTRTPKMHRWPYQRIVVLATTAILVVGALFFLQSLTPVLSDAKVVRTTLPAASPGLNDDDLRLIVGSANPYTDRSGRRWSPDRFFAGGSVRVRPSERVSRTLDPDLYRHLRTGDFRYDIPLKPGSYELHLHFAETGLADSISAESSGEGQRVFHVSANGARLLSFFDVVADAAGANIATERVFRDISPAEDGFVHLSFESVRGTAMVSGIELLPTIPHKVRPIRIRAGWLTAWQDSVRNEWQGDSYFMGGNALVRRTNPVQESNSISPDLALYTSERWGHFSYALPVAEGRYKVTLKFSEGHYGARNSGAGGDGSRIFDVYCNGVALLRDFDIAKAAGGEGRPIDRTFTGIRPSAQGKILLTFVPVKGMACVNGIEVEEE